MNQQEPHPGGRRRIGALPGRDLVASAEVVDVLLDLRLLLLEVETLEQLLDEPAPATGGVSSLSASVRRSVRMADVCSTRSESRREPQQRRHRRNAHVGVHRSSSLLVVVAAGVGVVAPRAGRHRRSAGAPTTPVTTAAPQARHRRDVSADRTRPRRCAPPTTKGGDIAVFASPDADAQPDDDAARSRPSTRCRAASSRSTSTRTGCTSTCRRVRTTPPAGSRRPTSRCRNPLEYQIQVSLADHHLSLLPQRRRSSSTPAPPSAPSSTPRRPAPSTHRSGRSAQDPEPRLRRVRPRPVRSQQRAHRVRRRRRSDRDPRHQQPGHIGQERVARLCARRQRRDRSLSTLPLGTPVVIT